MNPPTLPEKVQAFNALPRPKTRLSGLPNHWIIAIRHISLPPPGDLVFATHPEIWFGITDRGPCQITHLATAAEKAQAMLRRLLSIFLEMGQQALTAGIEDEAHSMAPWTWSCEDPELATALESVLRSNGVRAELCTVGTATSEEVDMVKKRWSNICSGMLKEPGVDIKTGTEAEKMGIAVAEPSDGQDEFTMICDRCGAPAA
jgi:hypothetical protein